MIIKNKIISSILQASPLTALSLFFQLLRPLIFINIALPTIGSDSFGIYVTNIAALTMVFVISDFGLGYRFRARGPKNPNSDETINLHNSQYSTHLISITLISILFLSYFSLDRSFFTGLSFVSFFFSQFLFYQIHSFYRYTSNFSMMNTVAIFAIVFQILLVFLGCKYGLITNNIELIALSSLGQIFPSFLFILHKRKQNWFKLNYKIITFIKEEIMGAFDVKLKQILDIVPQTADRLVINFLLGPLSVTIFYASMVITNILGFITKLLGQLTSQHFRVLEKKNSFYEIKESLKIMELLIVFLMLLFATIVLLLHDILIEVLDIFIGLNNIDLTVLLILFLNAFPMMARGIYNDFCIANEFTRNNRIDSSIYLLSFFGVIGISAISSNFMIWHVAIAHLISSIFCFIYMRVTLTKKLSYFSKGFNKK